MHDHINRLKPTSLIFVVKCLSNEYRLHAFSKGIDFLHIFTMLPIETAYENVYKPNDERNFEIEVGLHKRQKNWKKVKKIGESFNNLLKMIFIQQNPHIC